MIVYCEFRLLQGRVSDSAEYWNSGGKELRADGTRMHHVCLILLLLQLADTGRLVITSHTESPEWTYSSDDRLNVEEASVGSGSCVFDELKPNHTPAQVVNYKK